MRLATVYIQAGDPADVADVDEPLDPGPGKSSSGSSCSPFPGGELQAIQHGPPSAQVRAGVETTGDR